MRHILLLLFILMATGFVRRGSRAPFLPATRPDILGGSSATQLDMSTWKVTIIHDGIEKTLDVDESTSILEASLEAGIDLPHDCDLGVCLTCPAKVVSGTCDQSGGTLDDSVIEKGFALTCQSYPRSDMVIKSIEEDELVSAQFER